MKNMLVDKGLIFLIVPVEHGLGKNSKHLHYCDSINELVQDIDKAGLYTISAFYKTGLQVEYWVVCSRDFL